MITYPQEFIERVETEYKNWPEVVLLARENKYLLGHFLAEGSSMRISPEEIVGFLDNGDLESIRSAAESAVRRRKIHADWLRIMVNGISLVKDKNASRIPRLLKQSVSSNSVFPSAQRFLGSKLPEDPLRLVAYG
ncbi:MAG: hypothetical protein WC708_01435 [Lentisphaeria bacterium]|jgi:hypothetical protein